MRTNRWGYALSALSLAGVLTQPFIAQQVPLPTPGVIRINVNLVQVDAVVTDRDGKPVTDLKAEDFELFQDGKSQQIRNFEFVRVKDTLASMTVRPGALRPPNGQPLPPASSSALSPDQVRRTIALVVDDIALSYDGTLNVRESLRKWVDHEMQPGDLVSVVRTNAAMGALQQFTNDKRVLHAAINGLKYQPGRVGVETFAPFTPGGAERDTPPSGDTRFAGELRNLYITGSLNAVRYIMQGLRDLPGRKSLILFSEDLSLTALDRMRQSIEDRLQRLTDEANRSSVVIYAIDPRGVAYTGPTVSDNLNRQEGAAIADMIAARSTNQIESQDGMVLLAQRTGGLFFAGGNDLAPLVRRAIDDGDGYYLLGYQPDDDTFLPKPGVAKYHSISLRVKRPGLKVRSRTGFFGMSDASSAAAPPATPQAQIAKALVSPFATADLRVRLTTLFSHSDTEGSYIKTLLHFDARDLAFTEEPDGGRTVTVDIAVATFDDSGGQDTAVYKTWKLTVSKEAYDEVLRKGLVYSVPVPVKKAGPYQLRVALRDAGSAKLGSAMQFVDVPDVKSGRLTLSGIVVTADPPAANDFEGAPAVRIFRTGGAFAYAYEILNARTRGAVGAQLEARIRLYRDGELVFEGLPSSLSAQGGKDTNRFAVGGRMQLTRIPPGEYTMQINVIDKLRSGKEGSTSQTVDFEVRQ
jgi:VWFA-related protein